MLCSRNLAWCSALSRIARMPPWMRGCNVLTRPSSISGKPVTSATSSTFNPASASDLRVPPVETSSTPKPASALANSTSPVLSLTLTSARRMVRKSMKQLPGAITSGKVHLMIDSIRGWIPRRDYAKEASAVTTHGGSDHGQGGRNQLHAQIGGARPLARHQQAFLGPELSQLFRRTRRHFWPGAAAAAACARHWLRHRLDEPLFR